MSQEPATASQAPSERDVFDRLVVRVPALGGLIGRGVARLPPGSTARKRLIALQAKRLAAAMARSDVELLLPSYDPVAEVWMRSMAGVGISDCYRGHEGIRALYADLDDAFHAWSWTIRAVADGGDRMAIRGDFVGYGRGSGVETALTGGGTAVRYSARGLIVWQEWFVGQDGWMQALDAVGLSE